MGFFGGVGAGKGFLGGRADILALILVVLLFSGYDCHGLFNEETLAVIIILWLIYDGGFFGTTAVAGVATC